MSDDDDFMDSVPMDQDSMIGDDDITTTALKNVGRKLKMKFKVGKSNEINWFNGKILSYNPISKKYGIFFPCDKQTVFINLDEPDVIYMN